MPFLKPYKYPNWKIKEESTLKNGLRHTVFNSKGDTKYIGEWEHNEKSGKGVQIVKDKWVYEGDWLNGKRHGYGIMSYQDENMIRHITYEGEWKFGKPDGFGTKHYKDGAIYEGNFREGMRWGSGRIWYPDNSFYDGSWKNDKQCGSGLIVYANGNRYEGDWFDGMKYGQGTYYFLNKAQKQTGVWVEDTAAVSLIEDCQFQGATCPRQYPVPQVELENWRSIYNKEVQSKLHCCDARTTLMRMEWTKMKSKVSWE